MPHIWYGSITHYKPVQNVHSMILNGRKEPNLFLSALGLPFISFGQKKFPKMVIRSPRKDTCADAS